MSSASKTPAKSNGAMAKSTGKGKGKGKGRFSVSCLFEPMTIEGFGERLMSTAPRAPKTSHHRTVGSVTCAVRATAASPAWGNTRGFITILTLSRCVAFARALYLPRASTSTQLNRRGYIYISSSPLSLKTIVQVLLLGRRERVQLRGQAWRRPEKAHHFPPLRAVEVRSLSFPWLRLHDFTEVSR